MCILINVYVFLPFSFLCPYETCGPDPVPLVLAFLGQENGKRPRGLPLLSRGSVGAHDQEPHLVKDTKQQLPVSHRGLHLSGSTELSLAT